jgi:hypothetical protein
VLSAKDCPPIHSIWHTMQPSAKRLLQRATLEVDVAGLGAHNQAAEVCFGDRVHQLKLEVPEEEAPNLQHKTELAQENALTYIPSAPKITQNTCNKP